ncbi:endonuclease/exonuclease/phosphatase family protein [Mucisphaera sp.]|uniref:endonuclease/exonuclease/phosphatase family protein n=1 Tax=Mucisphaera sp. TaxID=2913024 RepID=UPI003D0EEE70
MRSWLLGACIWMGSLSGSSAMAQPIAFDGEIADWPEGTWALANPTHLKLRLDFDQLAALGRGGERVEIAIDMDADDTTGSPGHREPGADLVITLNEPYEWRGQPRTGNAAIGFDADGREVTVEIGTTRVNYLPTHAAESFEISIARSPDLPHMLTRRGLLSAGQGQITVQRLARESGAALGMPQRTTVTFPALARLDQPVPAQLPPRTPGDLRVLAYNVLWANPMKAAPDGPGAEPFVRMFQAMNPDVLLIQEWYDRNVESDLTVAQREARIADWFNTHLPDNNWSVVGSVGNGVYIVSRFPVLHRGPEEVRFESETRWSFPVRIASAVLDTPDGPVVFGSTHLKCCGTLNSPEDIRRREEAAAINSVLSGLSAIDGGRYPVVLGGDYNHNGHPDVVETLLDGLDADGSPLELLFPRVLGTNEVYTHGTPARGTRQNRLDYISPADAHFTTTAKFVLDTTRLDTASLRAAGLERDDIEASDHLPVVADLRPRRTSP